MDSANASPSSVSFHQKSGGSDERTLLSVSWIQDCGCFMAGTSCGFRMYKCDPLREATRKDLKIGGFGIVEKLLCSNITVLVGDSANSQYPPNKVLMWDDKKGQIIYELTLKSIVRSVKLTYNRLVIIFEHKIFIYNFTDMELIHQMETISNPEGICSLSVHPNTFVLACLGLQYGQVRVEHFRIKVTRFISAHDSQIACLSLTMDGLFLASASTKGTLIRIFNTMDGTLLQEVRRGAERAEIFSIAFSHDVQWLAVSSDKGTVHIFSLRVKNENSCQNQKLDCQKTQNSCDSLKALAYSKAGVISSSSLAFLKGVLPKYFSSEWSFAQYYVPEAVRCIAAFGSKNTVMLLGMDGSFHRCSFDPVSGGKMVRIDHKLFMEDSS